MNDGIIRTFEELRNQIVEDKQYSMECVFNEMDELSAFQLARYKGMIDAYDNVLEILRKSIKYGDIE